MRSINSHNIIVSAEQKNKYFMKNLNTIHNVSGAKEINWLQMSEKKGLKASQMPIIFYSDWLMSVGARALIWNMSNSVGISIELKPKSIGAFFSKFLKHGTDVVRYLVSSK